MAVVAVLCVTVPSFPHCCGLMPGRSRTVSLYSESAGALGRWRWALHICELGVHLFVSDEKIKDRLGVG